MSNGIVMIAANVWGQLFPERQFYIRSQGRVRYANLPPGVQFAGMAILVLGLSWSAFASVNFALQQETLVDRESQIETLRGSNARLAAELADVQQRFLSATSELELKQRRLASILTQTAGVTAGDTVAASAPLTSGASPVNPALLPRGRPDVFKKFQPDVLPRTRPVRPGVSLPLNLSMTALEGDQKHGHVTYDDMLLDDTRLSGARSAQNEVVAFLAADANTAVIALEKLINQTGLDADTMLRRRLGSEVSGGHAEGGPLLAVSPSMNGKLMRRPLSGDRAAPPTRKARLEMLREALFSLPLAEPVNNYYVSSKYGYRRDPFTQAKAFHSGIDMVAPRGTPVHSSAPGTIVFAGPNGPYGNMVEIDHGRGVKSRYAHLSKITVVRGQKIGLRDLIGLVGNTGRSGSAHLHFEVWFDGKARDPRNFLKAGENVFQRQG